MQGSSSRRRSAIVCRRFSGLKIEGLDLAIKFASFHALAWISRECLRPLYLASPLSRNHLMQAKRTRASQRSGVLRKFHLFCALIESTSLSKPIQKQDATYSPQGAEYPWSRIPLPQCPAFPWTFVVFGSICDPKLHGLNHLHSLGHSFLARSMSSYGAFTSHPIGQSPHTPIDTLQLLQRASVEHHLHHADKNSSTKCH